jgi:hypothetical protein
MATTLPAPARAYFRYYFERPTITFAVVVSPFFSEPTAA